MEGYRSSIAEWLEPAPCNSRLSGLNPAQILFKYIRGIYSYFQVISQILQEESHTIYLISIQIDNYKSIYMAEDHG